MSPHIPDTERSALALVDGAPQAEFTLLLRLPTSAKAGAIARIRPLLTCDLLLRLMRERGARPRYVREEFAQQGADADERTLLGLLDEGERRALTETSADPWIELACQHDQASERQSIPVGAFKPRFAHTPEAQSLATELDLQRLCHEFEPDALRYMNLNSPYRLRLSPEFALDARGHLSCAELEEAERRVEYFYRTRERLAAARRSSVSERGEIPDEISGFAGDVQTALAQDLDAPRALAAMMELLKQVNELAERSKSKKAAVGRNALDSAMDAVSLCQRLLGLGASDGQVVLARIRDRRAARSEIDAAEIARLVDARVEARGLRDFARADALRQEIERKGVELIDDPAGTHWRLP